MSWVWRGWQQCLGDSWDSTTCSLPPTTSQGAAGHIRRRWSCPISPWSQTHQRSLGSSGPSPCLWRRTPSTAPQTFASSSRDAPKAGKGRWPRCKATSIHLKLSMIFQRSCRPGNKSTRSFQTWTMWCDRPPMVGHTSTPTNDMLWDTLDQIFLMSLRTGVKHLSPKGDSVSLCNSRLAIQISNQKLPHDNLRINMKWTYNEGISKCLESGGNSLRSVLLGQQYPRESALQGCEARKSRAVCHDALCTLQKCQNLPARSHPNEILQVVKANIMSVRQ